MLHQSVKRSNSKLVVLKDMIRFRVSQVFKKELEARGFTGKLVVNNEDRVIEMIEGTYVHTYVFLCSTCHTVCYIHTATVCIYINFKCICTVLVIILFIYCTIIILLC